MGIRIKVLPCGITFSFLSDIGSEEGLYSKSGFFATSASDKLIFDYNHINTTLNGVKQANMILKSLNRDYL